MKTNSSIAKQAGIFLGSIAASTLLGLPVLAQTTSSPVTNAAPDPAAPGRSFPNQADPRAGQGEGSLNNGVSTPPVTGGNANEYNYQNRPSSENRPSEDRPTESRPAGSMPGNMQSPMMQPAPMSPERAPGRSESSDSQFRPAPSAVPNPAAPGVRELPNQADPRTGLPESQPQNNPGRSNMQSSTLPATPVTVTPGITDYPNQINPLTGASDVALERGSAVVPADGVSAQSGYRFSSQVYGTDRPSTADTVSLGQ